MCIEYCEFVANVAKEINTILYIHYILNSGVKYKGHVNDEYDIDEEN